MEALARSGLGPAQIAVVAAALRADPALELELESIVAALGEGAAARFWAELAAALPAHERPATAVLAALERAARG
jgi:hypothetical protein